MTNPEKYRLQSKETFDHYCHRISQYRKKDKLKWKDITSIINEECNVTYSEAYYKHKEYTYKKHIDEDVFKYKKVKAKLSDERTQLNALIRTLAREETLKEIAQDVVKDISKEKILSLSKITNNINNVKQDKEALLLISDWHYGVDVTNIYNTYNIDVAKQRVQQLCENVIDKCQKENITKLHIANLGDMISGNIHLPLRLNSRIDVITQTIQVSELLCEFIVNLSSYFELDYCSVFDNHSRLTPKKSDSIDLESFSRLIDEYIKVRLPELLIQENIYGRDIATMNILEHNIICTHGHKDNQINIISKLNNFTNMHFDLCCTAHMHHFSANEESGTIMIANGSLMGTDDYAFSKRLYSKPSQTLIFVSLHNVIDTIYKIDLV